MTAEQNNIPVLRFPEFEGEWSKVQIGDITDKVGSGSTPTGGEKVYTKSGIPFIRSQNVTDNGLNTNDISFIPEEINNQMLGSVVKPLDILLNITGASIGRVCVVPEDFKVGNVNQHVCIIRLKSEYNPYFFQAQISSFDGQKKIMQTQTGRGREGLNFQSIRKFLFSSTSNPEQQKIADFLSVVDERIQQLTRKKELLEQYKKGVMQQLFSRIIRFKTDDGNDYPDWEEKRLGEVAKYRRGSFPQPYGLKKWYNDENGYPFVQVFDVDDNMLLKENTKRRISDEAAELSVFAKKGTIVLTIQGSIGRIAITQYDAYVDRTLLIFRSFNMPMDKVFFTYIIYLLFEIEKQKAPGGTIKTITKEALSDFVIFIPVLDEQKKIADFLSGIDDKIGSVQLEIERTQQFKKGLLQQMFV